MRFQTKSYSCGPNAVNNALRAIGQQVSEALLIKYGGTTSANGTGVNGLKHCLEQLECQFTEVRERKYSVAEKLLLSHLQAGKSAVLLTEEGDHYEAAIGTLGNRVIIFDGQRYRGNIQECGVHVVQTGRALRRYWTSFEEHRWALLIEPKNS